MSRLTEKVKNVDDYIKLATKDKQEFINKLGKLEDLEEQIGINNLIAFLEWCVKFRNNFINRSFDDMVAFYKRAMCVTENKKE
jgi:hypothetical protein